MQTVIDFRNLNCISVSIILRSQLRSTSTSRLFLSSPLSLKCQNENSSFLWRVEPINNISYRCIQSNGAVFNELQYNPAQKSGEIEPSLLWSTLNNKSTFNSEWKPRVSRLSTSTDPTSSASTPNEGKPEEPKKKLTLWQKTKKEVVHYYHGFRLLGLEFKIASGICFRLLWGQTLTRRERKQLVRTVADLMRLVPFLVFVIVPFMEFLLPVYLKFFPFMLPSTFKEKSSESERIRQRLKAKLEMTRFLQETLSQTTSPAVNGDSPSISEFQTFLGKVQESGLPASTEDITRFSKLFEDQVTLDSLELKQLKMLCQLLMLPTIGPRNLLRFQIWMRIRQLKAEDRLIAKEGVDQIPTWELQSLCQDRGMRSVGMTEDRLRNQLGQWLALHLEKNVPVTLLLFSRALHVTNMFEDELPLKDAIAQLPASASEEATARVLETTRPADLDPRTKIEVLRKEQAGIKAARVQRKQELAEQKSADEAEAKLEAANAENLVDPAPELKGLPKEELETTSSSEAATEKEPVHRPTGTPTTKPVTPELTPTLASSDASPAPSVNVRVSADHTPTAAEKAAAAEKEKESEITEITREDLAQIQSAISQSSDALQEEAMEDLQEEVEETREKHEATLVTSEPGTDKRANKAASRLAARVSRMINDMDSMMDNLSVERKELLKNIELQEVHIKHSSEPVQKTEMLDAILAERQRVVDINDLLLALRRIQKVPDDTRWQKILEVLDEDHDGKIEMNHVLSVIELLGSENVKLNSKEISRVLEMLDSEQLAELVEANPPEESKTSTNSKSTTPPSSPNAKSTDGTSGSTNKPIPKA